MKRLACLVAVLVLAALVRTTPTQAAPPTFVVDVVQGEETSTGTIVGNTRQGATFSGMATGTLPGTFTVSVDYTPARPVCGGTNRITGGTFTLVTSTGTLTGRIAAGTVEFDPFCAFGAVSAKLIVTGGTGAYAGAHGSGRFTGLLNHLPLLVGERATLTGVVRLTLTSGNQSGSSGAHGSSGR